MDEQRELQITEMQNYTGCMEDVTFQGIHLLQGAKDNAKDFKTYGKPEFKCPRKPFVPITFLSRMSYVKLTLSKRSQDNNSFSTSFKFRTFLRDGFLFSRSAIRVKFHLELSEGSLHSRVLTPNGTKTSLRLGSHLYDGQWHSVEASINGQSGNLKVSLDHLTGTAAMNRTSIMLAFANKSLQKIYAGRAGEDSTHRSFIGCMLNLKVDSHQLSLREVGRRKYSVDTTTGSCDVTNRCYPNPCASRGQCSHDGQDFLCKCDVWYEGKTCDRSIYEATCQAYKRLGLRRDTYCLLNSKYAGQPEPYTAMCNVTGDRDRAYTIVSHDGAMEKTRIGSGRLDEKFLKHDITYNVPMEQIVYLIQRSAECRQYIRYDCHNSKLLNSVSTQPTARRTHAYWRARDKSMQISWGGAPPGSGQCACGVTQTCANKAMFCNCDSRRNSWLVDDGYLTDEDTLPVTQVAFKNKSARSFFTLGPLECWGVATKSAPGDSSAGASDEADEAKKLLHICPNIVPPTTASTAATTELATTVDSRSYHPCVSAERIVGNRACLNSTTRRVPSTKINTETKVLTPKRKSVVSKERQDPPRGDGLSAALTALLSCSLVVVLLLTVKFGLPRVIVCIRSHSKRGEYVVPPAGVAGYPARLMPLVTGRKASFRGRLTHNHIEKHVPEGNGAAAVGMNSYWVWGTLQRYAFPSCGHLDSRVSAGTDQKDEFKAVFMARCNPFTPKLKRFILPTF